MTKTLAIQVTKQPEPKVEIEEIDLSELEEDYLEYYGGEEEEDLGEYYVEEESDRSSPPSTGDLGVFEIYEGFEYIPYDNNGKFISPTSELNDPDCDILYDEALLDRENEERYELLTWNKPEPEQFKCFEDYKNAKWGYDSTTFMSGTEQAFQIWNQISPIAYRNGRWVVPSTSGKNSKVYDFRWAFACKTSFADLPETRVYTANQLSDEAGIPTKTLKKMMLYTPDSPFIQISDRYFMSIDDLKLIIEHHPEVFALIKDHPKKGPEYISGLITFAIKGIYPNKLELIKFVGQNGFETLVKYNVLRSMHTLGHRFSYYHYRTPDKSWFKIDEENNIIK